MNINYGIAKKGTYLKINFIHGKDAFYGVTSQAFNLTLSGSTTGLEFGEY